VLNRASGSEGAWSEWLQRREVVTKERGYVVGSRLSRDHQDFTRRDYLEDEALRCLRCLTVADAHATAPPHAKDYASLVTSALPWLGDPRPIVSPTTNRTSRIG